MKFKLQIAPILLALSSFSPEVMAQAKATYPLDWDGKEGELFEVEITAEDKSTVIETKQLKESSYHFPIPHPGSFFWRVRQKKEDTWSPFSEFHEIKTADKISLVNKPLMKKATMKGNEVTFEWNEPYKEFSYVLKIYRGKSPKPILSVPVEGGMTKLTIDKDDEYLYWRVNAVSSHGNESKDKKKFLIHSSKSLETKQIILRMGAHQTANTYEQTSDDQTQALSDKSLDLSGLGLYLKGEYWKNKFGAVLSARHQALKDSDTDFTETEFNGEFGYRWKKSAISSHHVYAGFLYGSTILKFDNTEGTYNRGFLTARYQYERFLSSQVSAEINGTLLIGVQNGINSPSYRIVPAINYYINNNWWLSAFAGLESYDSKLRYDEGGSDGDLEIQSKVTLFGLTVNWKTF